MKAVLRLAAGDALTLFDGAGGEYPAEVVRLGKSGVTVRMGERREIDRESPLVVTLAQAVSSGERMDYTIQKAVELGVARIEPLIASRCVVRLSGERAAKRVQHWHAVAAAACEQCGRNRMPAVAPVAPYADWLAQQAVPAPGSALLLAPRGDGRLRELPRPAGPVTLLAGPEGGFSPQEADAAARAGFTPIRLGPRVLRTETAAVAALAALQVLWGDF